MPGYWVYQLPDGLWEAIEERKRVELFNGREIIAGSLHLVEAKHLASALATVVPAEEIIERVFHDVELHGNDYAHDKWFREDEFTSLQGKPEIDEDGGMNKEAASLLAGYQKRL